MTLTYDRPPEDRLLFKGPSGDYVAVSTGPDPANPLTIEKLDKIIAKLSALEDGLDEILERLAELETPTDGYSPAVTDAYDDEDESD